MRGSILTLYFIFATFIGIIIVSFKTMWEFEDISALHTMLTGAFTMGTVLGVAFAYRFKWGTISDFKKENPDVEDNIEAQIEEEYDNLLDENLEGKQI